MKTLKGDLFMSKLKNNLSKEEETAVSSKLENKKSKKNTKNQGKTFNKKLLSKAVLIAAERAGKQFGEEGLISYLEAQALEAPSPFISLLIKIISEIDDEDDDMTRVNKIEIIAPDLKPHS